MNFRKAFLLFATHVLFIRCSSESNSTSKDLYSDQKPGQAVSHDAYSVLLQKYVSTQGKVNYKDFLKDSTALNHYLESLSNNPPAETWSRAEQLAYWINAYNGFTLQLILRNYPVKSIKDIGSKIKIPFVNTPWDKKFIRIGQTWIDLNHIEHSVLRKEFNEPRIHFAIVCASVSCPTLLNEAYTAANLEQQLNNQARIFINDPSRNQIQSNRIQISKIFSWFKGDFTQRESLIEFLNKYSQVKINPDARVSTLDYNWNLNE
ncbi:DUF547 domain-containing protein [Adhaeribacter radiodurans]|uniref:DUF547 domain-containing protein n=1 Tax=Adhaeribacter radiodurans TaxID=2745197 RepID=A0A7L7L799_9BACT|nr:DUF547 domain-containing protein [Adhaeribacter radiodurans]QMU28680.1 DUF547 domain-containing protein [Adhaeribacter radiodurans]